jgi:hypothetical protein
MKRSTRIAALLLVCSLLVWGVVYAVDFTRATTEEDAWAAVAANSSWESGAISMDATIGKTIAIDIASTSTNAVTAGQELLITIWAKSGADDDMWHVYRQYKHSGATAATQVLAAASGPEQANPDRVELADTSNFDDHGSVYFLQDADAIGESEIVCCLDVAANDYMQAIDALVRDHDTDDAMFNIVSQTPVRLNDDFTTYRVTAHTQDDNATYAIRVRSGERSDLE